MRDYFVYPTNMVVLINTWLIFDFVRRYDQRQVTCLSSGGSELCNSLGSLGDGVLGELTRKDESDSSLDLTGRQGGLLVIARKSG